MTDRMIRERRAWIVVWAFLLIGLLFGGMLGYKLGRIDQQILEKTND